LVRKRFQIPGKISRRRPRAHKWPLNARNVSGKKTQKGGGGEQQHPNRSKRSPSRASSLGKTTKKGSWSKKMGRGADLVTAKGVQGNIFRTVVKWLGRGKGSEPSRRQTKNEGKRFSYEKTLRKIIPILARKTAIQRVGLQPPKEEEGGYKREKITNCPPSGTRSLKRSKLFAHRDQGKGRTRPRKKDECGAKQASLERSEEVNLLAEGGSPGKINRG